MLVSGPRRWSEEVMRFNLGWVSGDTHDIIYIPLQARCTPAATPDAPSAAPRRHQLLLGLQRAALPPLGCLPQQCCSPPALMRRRRVLCTTDMRSMLLQRQPRLRLRAPIPGACACMTRRKCVRLEPPSTQLQLSTKCLRPRPEGVRRSQSRSQMQLYNARNKRVEAAGVSSPTMAMHKVPALAVAALGGQSDVHTFGTSPLSLWL